MKIAQIVSTYLPYRGGMGNVAQEYAKRLRKKGHEVTVFTPFYPKLKQDLLKVEKDTFYLKPLVHYGNSAFIPQVYKSLDQFDLIHLHYPFFGGAEAVAFFKKRHPEKPLVISYHMDVMGNGLLKAFFSFYAALVFPLIIRQADKIVVSSTDYASHSFLSHHQELKPKISEIPFGVDDSFSVNKTYHHGKKILFVGGLDKAHYFKGLHILLEALEMLDPDITLEIVGDGDLRGRYEQMVENKLLKKQVRFRGRLPQEKLVEAYQHADITVLPSVDCSEAFGLVLIESMACGTPVIASALPGVRSVVAHRETGYLVEPNNPKALANTLQQFFALSDDERMRMREASKQRVEAFYRWPENIDKLEKIYAELL